MDFAYEAGGGLKLEEGSDLSIVQAGNPKLKIVVSMVFSMFFSMNSPTLSLQSQYLSFGECLFRDFRVRGSEYRV